MIAQVLEKHDECGANPEEGPRRLPKETWSKRISRNKPDLQIFKIGKQWPHSSHVQKIWIKKKKHVKMLLISLKGTQYPKWANSHTR